MKLPETLKDWLWVLAAIGGGLYAAHSVIHQPLAKLVKDVASDSVTARVTDLYRFKCGSPEDWSMEYESLLQKHLARYKELNGREYDAAC